MKSPTLTMNDGRSIPQLGLGVYQVPNAETPGVVRAALEVGYRHIDTASLYENERGVGEGIRSSGVPREDVFVTTKVWNDSHGYDETLAAFDASLDRLGFDYVDLYLIHWPQPALDRYLDTWRALEQLRAEGRARSIGVSNFKPVHLDRMLAESTVVPAVNQVELHPLQQQWEVRVHNSVNGILTESWAPLAKASLLDHPVLVPIAHKHGKTVAQVIIRWHLQLGNVVIPKSVTPARIAENFDVFDFELDSADLDAILALDANGQSRQHPPAR